MAHLMAFVCNVVLPIRTAFLSSEVKTVRRCFIDSNFLNVTYAVLPLQCQFAMCILLCLQALHVPNAAGVGARIAIAHSSVRYICGRIPAILEVVPISTAA
jgi:hypothetical protein